MAVYDANNTRYVGTIDVESDTIVPQFTKRDATTTDGYFRADKAEKFSFQLFSDDIDGDITWTLQISLDGTNWATITTTSITASGVLEYTMSDVAYKYIRTNVTTYDDGTQTETYTTYVYAGN